MKILRFLIGLPMVLSVLGAGYAGDRLELLEEWDFSAAKEGLRPSEVAGGLESGLAFDRDGSGHLTTGHALRISRDPEDLDGVENSYIDLRNHPRFDDYSEWRVEYDIAGWDFEGSRENRRIALAFVTGAGTFHFAANVSIRYSASSPDLLTLRGEAFGSFGSRGTPRSESGRPIESWSPRRTEPVTLRVDHTHDPVNEIFHYSVYYDNGEGFEPFLEERRTSSDRTKYYVRIGSFEGDWGENHFDITAVRIFGGPAQPDGAEPEITEADPSDQAASELLRRVAETYARLATYEDSGVVRLAAPGREERDNTEIRFTTRLRRSPGRFRLEFMNTADSGSHYLVHARGILIRKWSAVNEEVEYFHTIGSVLAAAAEPSAGVTRHVPGLLLRDPIEAGWSIMDLENLQLLPGDTLEGAKCLRIQGEIRANHPEGAELAEETEPAGALGDDAVTMDQKVAVIWVDRKSSLIRRIDEKVSLPIETDPETFAYRTKKTILYRPAANHPIPDEKLAFEPSDPSQ